MPAIWLKLAVHELETGEVPPEVSINEAVAFAKRYFNALNAYFYPDEFEGLTLPWKVSFVGDQDRQAIILQHMMSAVAMNLARFAAWSNEIPLAETRTSPFAALATAES